jgi:hypothetical protein
MVGSSRAPALQQIRSCLTLAESIFTELWDTVRNLQPQNTSWGKKLLQQGKRVLRHVRSPTCHIASHWCHEDATHWYIVAWGKTRTLISGFVVVCCNLSRSFLKDWCKAVLCFTWLGVFTDLGSTYQEYLKAIGTACMWGGTSVRGRVNEGDSGEGISLIDFIYIYEIGQRNLLQLL